MEQSIAKCPLNSNFSESIDSRSICSSIPFPPSGFDVILLFLKRKKNPRISLERVNIRSNEKQSKTECPLNSNFSESIVEYFHVVFVSNCFYGKVNFRRRDG